VRRLLAALLLGTAACARIASPPGGPPDRRAPLLVSTTPDSLRVLPDFKGNVEFAFDEVVSEGGSPNFGLGTGGLERLVILSPSKEVPVVRWKRDRITVRPREGWQPDRVYRVELLAGVQDLRNNLSKTSTVVTFTTGAPLPVDTLIGRVVDWTTQRPVPQGMVQAVLYPDSLVYHTVADSTGRFRFGPLPAGEYQVFAAIDQNRNGRRDTRESFDSVRVIAGRDSVGELWVFRHDTTAARIQTVARTDSVTATITFSMSLDPYQRLEADSAELLALPDSTPVPVEAVLPQVTFDSLYRVKPDTVEADSAKVDSVRADSAARAVRDSTEAARRAAAADTTPRRIPGVPRQVTGARIRAPVRDTLDTGPLTTKPPLFDKLLLRSGVRLADSGRYVVRVHGVRSVSGVTGTAQGVLTIEKAKPTAADSARKPAAGDSARARADTVAARRDSTRTPADTIPPRPLEPRRP
jgi:hypothetical protein